MLRINLRDEIFGNEAGEDEDIQLLESYFVDNSKFNKFLDFEKKISIISAKKGMGKSALLMILYKKLQDNNQKFVIKETGNNLLSLGSFNGTDSSYLENYWKQVICKRINIEIGKKINLALNDTSISMVESAEINGFKSKNMLSALIDRLSLKIPMLPEKKEVVQKNSVELLRRYKDENKDQKIWILIDDIDAKYLDDESNQARVSAFFSAIRSLVNEMEGLYIRTTIRSDVWTNLRYIEDLDKIEQYKIEINWTQKQIRDILSKQILAYVKRKHPDSKEAAYEHETDYNSLFKLIFESPIQWQGQEASIFNAIHAFSNKRPRWLNQVCRMGLEQAIEANSRAQKVKLENLNQIMQKFGRNRKADLLKEHGHQFEELDSFIDSFRGHKKEYSYDDLMLAINSFFVRERDIKEISKIDGLITQNVHDLGAFAYKIGLISHKDGTNFTHYNDHPDLFNSMENRTNRLNWSIHISYWEYLNLRH
ncbi:hypothetical protein MMP66_16905 [Acinetobacter dispersus]|uniref:P-loop ATPase, Sll1717 family n=1 Tax=Acinetobacter dispersus TaxID=70348 RepID=UPI001F4A432E|nr:hypothetical protein [Acinetobacter dispersus]MCH7395933.1 hypothetical protein [Acinetobacter dispersus]